MSNTDFLTGKAAEMVQSNPSVPPAKAMETRRRIPMALPEQKLRVPEIPGYRCHWFRGTQQRLQQAQAAGYEFVDRDEVELTNTGLANDALSDGNTDLGSRVSLAASDGADGEGMLRLYLMKLRKEYFDEDERLIAEKHEKIAATIRGDGVREAGQDNSNRYVPKTSSNSTIFTPKRSG